MFFIDMDDVLLDNERHGKVDRMLSSSEKAIVNCNKVNWFLYRAKYLLGKDFGILEPKIKKDVLEGFMKWVMCGGSDKRNVVEMLRITSLPTMRRARLLK